VGIGNLIADAVRHGQDHYKESKRMNELQAKQIAEAFSGEAWQSGGGIWLVLLFQKYPKSPSKFFDISDLTFPHN
jgi:hypothetical protein